MERKHIDSVGLTIRQLDVASLVMDGHRNKEVADRLGITEKTVKYHLTEIFKVAKVKSRCELMARYYKV